MLRQAAAVDIWHAVGNGYVTMPRRFVRRWAVLLLIGVMTLAVACGGSDDGGSSAASSASDASASSESSTDQADSDAPTDDELSGPAAGPGDRVSVLYHGTLDNGEVFDSSRDRGQPFPFTVGAGDVIAGFDTAVTGLRVGEVRTVRIPPAEAYGESDPNLIVDVPIAQAPPGVQIGDPVTFQSGARGEVVAIEDGIVTIDGNPALAGEALTFEIELLSIE
jgi:FKBP-type peptidyl-prolyl cis-trans isomerase 2